MRRMPFLLLLAILSPGCEDSVGPDRTVPLDLEVVIPDFGTMDRDSVPLSGDRPAVGDEGDFSEAPSIFWSRIESGFLPHAAWAQAAMEFWANRATIDLELNLRYNNTYVGKAIGVASFGQWIPWRDRLDTSAALSVTGDCGHVIDANGIFAAWHEPAPNTVWGENRESKPSVAAQPTCDPEPVKVTKEIVKSGGNNNEDDADWYICYYTYYYDSYTGKLLRTEFHGCEPL